MLCENCGKREVEVLIKQVTDNDVRHMSLCRECAGELGFVSSPMPSITISFSIADEPPKIRKVRRVQPKRREQAFDSVECSGCGTKFAEFREDGFLGCPNCYEAFRFPLGAYLQKTQGAESHWIGSELFRDIELESDEMILAAEQIKKRAADENIAKLRLELNEAVSREDYERAAEIRDMLVPLVGDTGRKNG
ncbi:MAG: UvrB/UvrC motif-containing protein [Synergistaceae bacterium]|jgi:protein arginine kinase activator|nr:UvrB/UvrC motif-containing protein [Synergistaceae bacterium]